ncbi:MAG TPA: hypothetical protein VGI56_14735 [Galbitalea sp.]|jgi:hypothetical protein
MRWDDLFDDLESQLERELSAEEVDLLAEEERLRVARLSVRDRLLSLSVTGTDGETPELRLILCDGTRLSVTPSTFGRDWFSGEVVDESGKRPGCVVPLDAVDAVLLARVDIPRSIDSARRSETQESLSARLGLAFVLRDLCRRRAAIDLQLPNARLHGTIDRVGRDHLDLAVHERGRPRRDSEVSEYRLVRIAHILLVRT